LPIQKDYETAQRIVWLTNAITNHRNRRLQVVGLTSRQHDALRFILNYADSQAVTAADVMGELRLSQSTVSSIIGNMESKGFIVRETDVNDTRKSLVRPTQKARELREALKNFAIETEQAILGGMNETEKAEFNRLLQHALDNLTALHENVKSEYQYSQEEKEK
jgi:DNA-binding MarR family transcriptional regulator